MGSIYLPGHSSVTKDPETLSPRTKVLFVFHGLLFSPVRRTIFSLSTPAARFKKWFLCPLRRTSACMTSKRLRQLRTLLKESGTWLVCETPIYEITFRKSTLARFTCSDICPWFVTLVRLILYYYELKYFFSLRAITTPRRFPNRKKKMWKK